MQFLEQCESYFGWTWPSCSLYKGHSWLRTKQGTEVWKPPPRPHRFQRQSALVHWWRNLWMGGREGGRVRQQRLLTLNMLTDCDTLQIIDLWTSNSILIPEEEGKKVKQNFGWCSLSFTRAYPLTSHPCLLIWLAFLCIMFSIDHLHPTFYYKKKRRIVGYWNVKLLTKQKVTFEVRRPSGLLSRYTNTYDTNKERSSKSAMRRACTWKYRRGNQNVCFWMYVWGCFGG